MTFKKKIEPINFRIKKMNTKFQIPNRANILVIGEKGSGKTKLYEKLIYYKEKEKEKNEGFLKDVKIIKENEEIIPEKSINDNSNENSENKTVMENIENNKTEIDIEGKKEENNVDIKEQVNEKKEENEEEKEENKENNEVKIELKNKNLEKIKSGELLDRRTKNSSFIKLDSFFSRQNDSDDKTFVTILYDFQNGDGSYLKGKTK
jgi:hypothetical protein